MSKFEKKFVPNWQPEISKCVLDTTFLCTFKSRSATLLKIIKAEKCQSGAFSSFKILKDLAMKGRTATSMDAMSYTLYMTISKYLVE